MDTIPAPIDALLDLFATELKGIRFGDLDGEALSERAKAATGAAEAVEEARAVLDRAEAALRERQAALLEAAHRSLAYARIYAEGKPDLARLVDEIALPKAGKRAKPDDRTEAASSPAASDEAAAPPQKRRGRKPGGPAGESLSLEGVGASSAAAE